MFEQSLSVPMVEFVQNDVVRVAAEVYKVTEYEPSYYSLYTNS